MSEWKTVLDVGFGLALYPNATHGLDRITRQEWKEIGGQNPQKAKLRFEVNWNGRWPYATGYFDRIVSYHAIGIWPTLPICYAEMLRVLAGGGHSYIYVGKFQSAKTLAEVAYGLEQAGFQVAEWRELKEMFRVDGKKKKTWGCGSG